MTVLVFQRLGVMPVSTDSWNSCENIGANSSAQVRRRWPEMLSGPEVFLPCYIIFGGDDLSRGRGVGGDGCQISVHLDVKSLLSKRM